MQPLQILAKDFSISDQLSKQFKSYIGISAKSKDKSLISNFTNVFSTNIHQQQPTGQITIFNNFDIAFAVGLVFDLIVEQQIDVFEYIEATVLTSMNENQTFAIQLLKYTIYQLHKADSIVYLNNILGNKTFPKQQLKGDVDLSKIYTFVHLCELGALFKPFQTVLKFQFWNSYQNQSLDGIDQYKLFFYQPSPQYFETIQQKIHENHQEFMKNIGIQLLLDLLTKTNFSPTIENLKIQPYKFNNMQDLAAVLFFTQPNYQDRVLQFLKIPQLDRQLGFLIQQGFTIDSVLEGIKAQQEQECEVGNSNQKQSKSVFETQYQPENNKDFLRKTERYPD